MLENFPIGPQSLKYLYEKQKLKEKGHSVPFQTHNFPQNFLGENL